MERRVVQRGRPAVVRRASRAVAGLLAATWLSGCTDESGAGGDGGGCQPGCHWDCFGSVWCSAGQVVVDAYGARPCCQPGEMSLDEACRVSSTPCPTGRCAEPTVYGACATRRNELRHGGLYGALPASLTVRVFCEGGALKRAGAACTSDDDCRPAAPEHAGGLRCAPATQRCVAATRPTAPAGYGAHCGATPRTGVAEGIAVTGGRSCDLCAIGATPSGCLGQACTIACDFDEDCPDGSLCACAAPLDAATSLPRLGVCLLATSRDAAELTRSLRCGPSGPDDAGVSDAGPSDADPSDAGR